MSHISWKAGNILYPLPVVLVSCGNIPSNFNVLTIAWAGTICTDPPMISISIRPERHSYQIIKSNKEFTVNLVNEKLARAADYCGVRSGRDTNKFKDMKLELLDGELVKCPSISQSPVSIECKVDQIIELGSHHMFIAEVLKIRADEALLNKKTGKFDLAGSSLVAYNHGGYYKLGDFIGKFGYSVQKKK